MDDVKLTTNRYVKGGPRCEIPGHTVRVQTRGGIGELKYFSSVKEAFTAADQDDSIWKVSFGLPNGERVRLVRGDDGIFYYEDIITEVNKALEKEHRNGDGNT